MTQNYFCRKMKRNQVWIAALLLLIAFMWPSVTANKGCKSSTQDCPQTRFLFPRSEQVSDYIRFKPAVPDINDISACMWLTPVPDDEYTMISYATKTHANAFIVMVQDSKLAVYRSAKKAFDITLKTRSYLCVVASDTFKSVAVYVNGVLKTTASFRDGVAIEGGGSLIFGQEQDAVAGTFQATQSYTGDIENLMMWYRILTPVEIAMMYKNKCTCAPGYGVALIPEWIQLEGSVTAQPTQPC